MPRTPTRRRFGISPLVVKIIFANLIGLCVLFVGTLRANQYRDGLIEAKLEGVRAQAEVIASLMAGAAAVDADCDVDFSASAACTPQLDEDTVNVVFTSTWQDFSGRVRVFTTPEGYDGGPITDVQSILLQDQLLRADRFDETELPDIETLEQRANTVESLNQAVRNALDAVLDGDFRDEVAAQSFAAELTAAFRSDTEGAATVRYNEEGQIVASVSVPIQRVSAVYGVVTAENGGIEALVAESRRAQLNFFWVASAVSIVLMGALTMTIARPIRQLAEAADQVRDGLTSSGRIQMPRFPSRQDEIGVLSDSFRSMTKALESRIESIDNFAADVSHEIKNPLTSIRSAVETLDLAKDDAAKQKLIDIIKDDVARMDRLITDISNASRLDADLARQKREPVNVGQLLKDIVRVYGQMAQTERVPVVLAELETAESTIVMGSPSALGQVFRNLIDNALSFSPEGGTVRVAVSIQRTKRHGSVDITVSDDGPGIPPDTLERIFERFYTKRPAGARFGNNSGLGLAICRQIVEGHQGAIRAGNRWSPDRQERLGATFTVTLPLARKS